MPRLFFVMGCLLVASISVAQTTDSFEEFKRKREQEMNSFEDDYKRGLDSLREAQNRDFALLLAGKWSEREVSKAPPVLAKPKPENPPAVEEEKPAEVPVEPVILPETDEEPEVSNPPVEVPSEPLPQREEGVPQDDGPQPMDEGSTYRRQLEQAATGLALAPATFYGNATWMPVIRTWPVCQQPLSSSTIAAYWKQCSEQSVDGYLSYLRTQHDYLHLSDWALLALTRQWSQNGMSNRTDAALFTWFILVQHGFDVRLMYTERGVYLAYPFEGMFYGRSYIAMNGLKYFLLDENSERSLFTYDGSHAGAKQVFSLQQNSRTVFPDTQQSRTIAFAFEEKQYRVDVPYNSERSAYYATIPQAELDFYFGDAGAVDFESACNSRLRTLVDAFPAQREKVRFLYALVCGGIPYATDQEQFGYEKFCIAEESLQHSHADCEDRTFLLNYLIRTFVGAPTIGLNYPGHVAMAVMLDEVKPGDARFNYKNQTWVFCDPTYIGADVGMMPGVYEGQTPQVFE